MRSSVMLAAALSALVFTACYQSPVPIAGTALPIDPNLVGRWEEIEPEHTPTIVTIHAASATEYDIELPWGRGTSNTLLKARGVLTVARGATFASLRDIDPDDPGFLILRLTRSNANTMVVATLKENVPRFDTAQQLHAYLAEHANDAAIIQDELRLRKVSGR